MELIQTPLIDAALAANEKLATIAKRYAAAKAILVADEVYNAALGDVKRHLADALEKTLEPITWKFVEKYRGASYIRTVKGDMAERCECDPTYFVQLNHCKGLPKKFKTFNHLSEIQDYLAVVAEGAVLWAAVEAAKARAISGRQRSENPTPIDLTNTGTCSICANLQKLRGEGMAHHGYKISNGNSQYFGYRAGRCFGCNYPPYELSCAGNKAYKPILERERAGLAGYLDRLVAGKITELKKEERVPLGRGLYNTITVIVKIGESDWKRLYETTKADLEWKIRGLTQHIEHHAKLIADWKPQPLPGDKKP